MTPVDWLLAGDTGISSKTICAVMTGSSIERADIPYDAGDFGRCYRLLRLFPVWRLRLSEVAERCPKWGPMVEAWDELTAMYEQISDSRGDYSREIYEANKPVAEAMYSRMKQLVDAGRLADGWTQTGPGSWSKGGSFTISITSDDAKRMQTALRKTRRTSKTGADKC